MAKKWKPCKDLADFQRAHLEMARIAFELKPSIAVSLTAPHKRALMTELELFWKTLEPYEEVLRRKWE